MADDYTLSLSLYGLKADVQISCSSNPYWPFSASHIGELYKE
jgi:hypothetical protein